MKEENVLSKVEIEKELTDLIGWHYENNTLTKKFVFPDFLNAIKFIDDLVPYFEK